MRGAFPTGPSRARSSTRQRAVRDLLMVLRAVADPTNLLHVVSALRTPLFACGDDDLFRFHARHPLVELPQPPTRGARRR